MNYFCNLFLVDWFKQSTAEYFYSLDEEDKADFIDQFVVNNQWASHNEGVSVFEGFIEDFVLRPIDTPELLIPVLVSESGLQFKDIYEFIKELAEEFNLGPKPTPCTTEESEESVEEDSEVEEDSTYYGTIENRLVGRQTISDNDRTVLVYNKNCIETVPLIEFAKVQENYRLTTPDFIGNEGKFVWRKASKVTKNSEGTCTF